MAKPEKHLLLQTKVANLTVGYVWGGAPVKKDENWLHTYNHCNLLIVVQAKTKGDLEFFVQILRVDIQSSNVGVLHKLKQHYALPTTLITQASLLEIVSQEIESLGSDWLWKKYRNLHEAVGI